MNKTICGHKISTHLYGNKFQIQRSPFIFDEDFMSEWSKRMSYTYGFVDLRNLQTWTYTILLLLAMKMNGTHPTAQPHNYFWQLTFHRCDNNHEISFFRPTTANGFCEWHFFVLGVEIVQLPACAVLCMFFCRQNSSTCCGVPTHLMHSLSTFNTLNFSPASNIIEITPLV